MNAEKGRMRLICERADNDHTRPNNSDKFLRGSEWQQPLQGLYACTKKKLPLNNANELHSRYVEQTTSSARNKQNTSTTVITSVRGFDVLESIQTQTKRRKWHGPQTQQEVILFAISQAYPKICTNVAAKPATNHAREHNKLGSC